MEKYLPIGSLVTLKGSAKKILIYGRCQMQMETEKVWDYIGCPYPEGNISPDQAILFQHETIEQIYAMGYRDEEEFHYLKTYLNGQGVNQFDNEVE